MTLRTQPPFRADHVGSLPRPERLLMGDSKLEMIELARMVGEPILYQL